MSFPSIRRIAVTTDNFDELAPRIAHAMANTSLIGLDLETESSRQHAGLAPYNGRGKKLVFDLNRTTICGLSLWADGNEEAWYFNLAHADVETRIPWASLKALLDLKPPAHKWVIHHANFERTMLAACQDYDIADYICTMQMCVSAYGPDEYDENVFYGRDLGGIGKLIPQIIRGCITMTETAESQEVISKVIAKESDAEWSYNGYVKDMAYGYGLKQAIQAWFGYQMATYEQTLAGREHMGQLTSLQTADYGCDDAIWCVRLYHRILQYMLETNPAVVSTFFNQELPCTEVYSEAWRTGVRINVEAVAQKKLDIRKQYADGTRKLKALIRGLLPFPEALHEGLIGNEKWYRDNGGRYRTAITEWANSEDHRIHFKQATQLSGAIPNAWAAELGIKVPKGLNLTHYMLMRVLMYDLFGEKLILDHGKVQSDAEARGRMMKRVSPQIGEVLAGVQALANIETVSKLYVTPYTALLDPDTGKMYPVLGSELATRRTAMATPNAQQLSKRNPETTYVRGFYQADYEDHVIVSIDLSQIELVLIGEFSGDPYFADCYSQLPYRDLHEIAAADGLQVDLEEYRSLKTGNTHVSPHLLTNIHGEIMPPDKAFKYWRTEIGKVSNFSYWYSGSLYQVGKALGWEREYMFEASDRYRARFSVAEAWRMSTIQFVQEWGYVQLPDGHRRTRLEATGRWAQEFRSKFLRYDNHITNWFADKVIRRIQARANNQIINAMIQGSCATLIKRSLLSSRLDCKSRGWGPREARFMFPVHDEGVFSVHREIVPEFIQATSAIMCNHPEIISNLKMDCSPSIGLTFEPWDKKRARLGQIELREIPDIGLVPTNDVGKELPFAQWGEAVDWLFAEQRRA